MLMVRKEVRAMVESKQGGAVLAEPMTDREFNEKVKKLKARVLRRPFDSGAHRKLMLLYLGAYMFPETEDEQEILEWIDRIKRSVKLNMK
jgi:hypothetical protein